MGKGMRIYSCIVQVGLEGSPRRLFLCTYDIIKCMILTLYDVTLIR